MSLSALELTQIPQVFRNTSKRLFQTAVVSMFGVMVMLKSSSSVGWRCFVHTPKTQEEFSAAGSGAQSPQPRGLLSLAGTEQGRLCYVSAALSGTTQLFNESPNGFHTVLNSSLSWVELKKAREGLRYKFPHSQACLCCWLATGEGLAVHFRRNTTAEILISSHKQVFFSSLHFTCTQHAEEINQIESSELSSTFSLFLTGFFFSSLWPCLWDFPSQ